METASSVRSGSRLANRFDFQCKVALCLATLCLLTLVPMAFAQNYRSPLILSPYSLDFPGVLVGKTSGAQMVTVFNNGGSPQPVSSITATGEFSETDDCPKPPATLALQAACNIMVVFKPSALTLTSGTLTVSDDVTNTQLVVTLHGSGTAGKPTATISPASVTFPDQQPGVDSSPQTITVTNSGTETLNIFGIEVDGDFLALPTSTCNGGSAPLGPNGMCTVQIVFSPLSSGQRTGELSVDDNAEDSPQKVRLSGSGK
jgi:hypothetical protein